MERYSILLVMTECKLKPLLGTTKPRFSMISRMWRNWNSHRFHTLPVGMQNSTTTLEKLGSFFRSSIFNSQKLETNQFPPAGEWINKLWYTYRTGQSILVSNLKKHILYDSI